MRPAVSVGGIGGSSSLSQPLFDSRSDLPPRAANRHAAPLSDDDFRRLFYGDSSNDPDLSLLEGGLSFDLLDGGDSSTFAFDSMVDFDPQPVLPDSLDSTVGFPDPAPHEAPCVQPGFGASAQRCDEQGIAASS